VGVRRDLEYHPVDLFPPRTGRSVEIAGLVADHSCRGLAPIGAPREGVQDGLMACRSRLYTTPWFAAPQE
jgi:hypothetical protein